MKSPRDHAGILLRKGENDLIAARAILPTGRALDTVCFHAQQAAEKALKALLAAKDLPYPWRHDLGELMSAVKDHYPAAASLEKDILTLSPYAVELRYDDAADPSVDEAQTAVRIAERLFSMATGLLGERRP
jgi:HEPN domain-containing protein